VLQDADCGLYATTESATEAASFGSLVEIEGRTQPGAFAPIVVYSKLRVVEKAAALPRPLPPAGLDVGLSARTENAWTVVKGVLRPHSGSFAVATPDGELPLYFFQGDVGPLQDLVDAEVEVPGIFAVVHRARRVVGLPAAGAESRSDRADRPRGRSGGTARLAGLAALHLLGVGAPPAPHLGARGRHRRVPPQSCLRR